MRMTRLKVLQIFVFATNCVSGSRSTSNASIWRYYNKASATNRDTGTIQRIHHQWKVKFNEKNISEPDSSAEFIIAHVLGKKTLSGLNLQQLLTSSEMEKIDYYCEKRLTNMPIQYVLEEWNFGELKLKMKPPVFIPRPETQGLVDIVIDEINSTSFSCFNLLEVGCGSGAITLSLLHAYNRGKIKKELDITAIDKNIDAIHLTQKNAEENNIKNIKLLHCDVSCLPHDLHFNGIVSNPPYIPAREMLQLQPEVTQFESHLALDGGDDGLDVIRNIVRVADKLLPLNGWLWLEVDTSHPDMLRNLFDSFQLSEVQKDFLDKNRFVKLVKVS